MFLNKDLRGLVYTVFLLNFFQIIESTGQAEEELIYLPANAQSIYIPYIWQEKGEADIRYLQLLFYKIKAHSIRLNSSTKSNALPGADLTGVLEKVAIQSSWSIKQNEQSDASIRQLVLGENPSVKQILSIIYALERYGFPITSKASELTITSVVPEKEKVNLIAFDKTTEEQLGNLRIVISVSATFPFEIKYDITPIKPATELNIPVFSPVVFKNEDTAETLYNSVVEKLNTDGKSEKSTNSNTSTDNGKNNDSGNYYTKYLPIIVSILVTLVVLSILLCCVCYKNSSKRRIEIERRNHLASRQEGRKSMNE